MRLKEAFLNALPGALLGTAVGVALLAFFPRNILRPAGPADARFVAIGRAFEAGLGKAYATAILAGATELDDGKPVPDAVKAIGQAWDRNRQALFDKVVAPALGGVFPPGSSDAPTASERAALISALRSLAKGIDPDG